jgi:hypothetical protein
MKVHRKVLGIETSCDEVAASVYDSQKGVLSNALFSQIALHKIMDIIQQKSDASGKIIEIDNYTQVQKPKPLGDNKNWRIVCTTKISYQELSDFIHTLNRKRSKSI